jgi:hypothetical protein
MRFMIIRRADANTEAGVMPGDPVLSDMLKYNQEMMAAGVFLEGVGLKPSSKGMRVRISGAKPVVIDGPFTETKELIAGFTMIEVKSREEALEWVKRWPPSDGPVELEVRQCFELEDFDPQYVDRIKAQREQSRR